MTEQSGTGGEQTRKAGPARRRPGVLAAAVIAALGAAIYWGLVASDRYVSEARIIVQRTDIVAGQTMDFSSLLGSATGGNSMDQLLLRDYLLSVDMLTDLDGRLNLRKHYSDPRRDLLSRMWDEHGPMEWFHRHYLARTEIEYDGSNGVLVVKAQAYEPAMAHAIAATLVQEGEHYMNAMAQRLAETQVAFLEGQVTALHERALLARQAVLAFQNQKGLVSPLGTVENVSGIVNRLEAQIADLQARRNAMLGYLRADSAEVVALKLQIDALQKQIAQEKGRLASTEGKALNEVAEEFQRLQLNAEFAQEMYNTAQVALEKGRVEVIRTLKKVSVLQSPTDPQYPLEPLRIYNSVVFALVALLVAGIVRLLGAIIRDHKD